MNKAELKAASKAARVSVELSGLVIPKDALTETEKYIEGEIEFEELINRLYQQT